MQIIEKNCLMHYSKQKLFRQSNNIIESFRACNNYRAKH